MACRRLEARGGCAPPEALTLVLGCSAGRLPQALYQWYNPWIESTPARLWSRSPAGPAVRDGHVERDPVRLTQPGEGLCPMQIETLDASDPSARERSEASSSVAARRGHHAIGSGLACCPGFRSQGIPLRAQVPLPTGPTCSGPHRRDASPPKMPDARVGVREAPPPSRRTMRCSPSISRRFLTTSYRLTGRRTAFPRTPGIASSPCRSSRPPSCALRGRNERRTR
ncbi:hypothetical protein AEGHOMDF_4624 [Methylobacterium soli]|nr:hypothetical protein AEGHOMDF_4624 [Methylobacterium soli]